MNIGGVNLKSLNPAMGTDEDPEKWSDVHEKVVNRYRSIDGGQMPELNDMRTINIL